MNLRLDWCDHKAAKYAVEHWHYSKTLPRSKNVYIGVWEDGRFIGALVFGLGGGGATDGRGYGLRQSFELAELERVALTNHQSTVSRIVAIAIVMLRRHCPGLRLLVSYADTYEGHNGAIYQAGNWVYVGKTSADWAVIGNDGKRYHSRVASASGTKMHFGRVTKAIRPIEGTRITLPGKHKYLMPLDDEIRQRIEPLRKPYPKRVGSRENAVSAIHAGEGGVIPTPALQEAVCG